MFASSLHLPLGELHATVMTRTHSFHTILHQSVFFYHHGKKVLREPSDGIKGSFCIIFTALGDFFPSSRKLSSAFLKRRRIQIQIIMNKHYSHFRKKKKKGLGAPGWLSPLSIAFGSGHDLGVLGLSQGLGSLLSEQSASPSPHPKLCCLSLSLS